MSRSDNVFASGFLIRHAPTALDRIEKVLMAGVILAANFAAYAQLSQIDPTLLSGSGGSPRLAATA